jgi:hypothetical protein
VPKQVVVDMCWHTFPSHFFRSARAVLYNFCGLPPPHNDSPLLLQCLIDANVIVQVATDDSSVLRLAGDEDIPLVLNAQRLEWDEIQAPSDIVQANHDVMVVAHDFFCLADCCTF